MKILQHILTKKNKSGYLLSFSATISLQQQRKYIWSSIMGTSKLVVYVDFLNLLSQHNYPPVNTAVLCISGHRLSVFSIIEKTVELLDIDIIIFDSICACPWISPMTLHMKMDALRTAQSLDIYLLCESYHKPLLYVDQIISIDTVNSDPNPSFHTD